MREMRELGELGKLTQNSTLGRMSLTEAGFVVGTLVPEALKRLLQTLKSVPFTLGTCVKIRIPVKKAVLAIQ